jgi:cyclic pyranopterin phosphate synthase
LKIGLLSVAYGTTMNLPIINGTPARSTAPPTEPLHSLPVSHGEKRLVDSYGRVHNNLRISVTDRCNLRCTYCMPEDVVFLDRGELLTFEEISRFVRAVVPLGIDKIRLTGGEPLMRRDLARLVEMLVGIDGIVDVGLTTNGVLLAPLAQTLYDAGLRRINVSLDTLEEQRFFELSRRTGLNQVLAGIEAARAAGFAPVKLNAVIIRGVNECDVVPLARYARDHGCEMRYIEYMPIGAEAWERGKVYWAHEILERIEREIGALVPVENYDPRAPAMEFRYTDGRGHVGMIASVSRPFCASCNRVRLTADGKVRNCLFALDEVDVKGLLRSGGTDADLAAVVRANIAAKWEGHEINTARFMKPQRTMHAIGG